MDPVFFVSADDRIGNQRLDAYFERQAAKEALAYFADIDDDHILDRLVDAGFTPATLPALQLAPLAFVAWASDSVSDAECQAAVWSIHETRLHDFPAAMCRVQSWLDVRPDHGLWDLWVAYTRCRLEQTPMFIRKMKGDQLLRQATSVALASGGFLGFGKICDAEQVVLNGIRNVFQTRWTEE